MADDVYEGYHIPAGALITPNVWSVPSFLSPPSPLPHTLPTRSILHDPTIYTNPHAFNPHRFLTPTGTLDASVPPPDAGFGFGRRICPGRYFSMRAIWTACAQMLATFCIRKHKDDSGDGEVEFGQGLIV